MRDQEIVGLYEAYNSIYSNVNEEVEQLDEDLAGKVDTFLKKGGEVLTKVPGLKAAFTPVGAGRKTPTATSGGYRPETKKEEVETDLFDTILEYLVAEGYADTNEAAITIMANMSEEWREGIVEEVLDEAEGSYGQTPKARTAYGALANKRRATPAGGFAKRGEKTTKVKSAQKHFDRTGNPDAGNRGKKSTKPTFSSGKRSGMTQSDRDHSRGEAEYGHTGYDPDYDGPASGPGGKPKGKKAERQRKTGVSAD